MVHVDGLFHLRNAAGSGLKMNAIYYIVLYVKDRHALIFYHLSVSVIMLMNLGIKVYK